MTKSEFSDWFDYHCGCFPGLRTWRGKMTAAEQKDVVDAWYRLLRPCELEDAKAATDHLFRSADGAPHYERHPPAVRELAKRRYEQRTYAEPEVQYVDGEQVYRCVQCQDDGRVICWSQKSMAGSAREGTLGEPFTIYTCAVACDCQAGERYAKYLARFDPRKWLISGSAPHKQELERLRQFVEPTEEVAS